MAKQVRSGLGLWDRLVLLVAWIVTCGLVYLLGIYVGKGMQERLLGQEERIVRLPVTAAPSAQGEKPKTEKELTFYDTLVRDGDAGRPQPTSATPAKATAPATPPVTTAHAATPPATTARAVTPPAATGAPVLARQTPPVPVAPAVRPGALPLPVPASPSRREPAVATAPPPAVPLPPGPSAVRTLSGNWTVLANPTRSQEEAESLARQLRTRGYAANVVSVAREGGTWYRVAVGRFASSEQASEMMQRLRDREGVAHVFVAAE